MILWLRPDLPGYLRVRYSYGNNWVDFFTPFLFAVVRMIGQETLLKGYSEDQTLYSRQVLDQRHSANFCACSQ